MKGSLLLLLFCLTARVHSDSASDARTTEEYTENFREAFRAANISDSTAIVEPLASGVEYECELPLLDPPTSIHDLSPEYVDVVAAMGDSVTAGFGAGARNIIEDIIEYRGLSWSIGGAKDLSDVITLPNVLKKFNPDVRGFSTGIWLLNPNLNVAVSGAKAKAMRSQAETLVKKMKDKGITDEDWKVITIWIGGNDACDIKKDGPTPAELAATYRGELELGLDYLFENTKRSFVNLVEMIDIADLAQVTGLTCRVVHQFACSSILKPESLEMVSEASKLYNVEMRDLVESGKYDARDDFTVVLQPFFSETAVPLLEDGTADKSYFAPDCFHFSQLGHGVGATYLWNNMFEPLGSKTNSINWDDQKPLTCPVTFPYFATSKNGLSTKGLRSNNANSDDQDSPHGTNLTAILVGTGVGVLLVVSAAVLVIIVIRRRRQNGNRGPTEKMQLIAT